MLEKRGHFVKVFLEHVEISACFFLSEHFQKSICSGVFNSIGCGVKPYNFFKKKTLSPTFFWMFSKVLVAAISKHPHESIFDGI